MSEDVLEYLRTVKAKLDRSPRIRKAVATLNGLPEQKKVTILEAFMEYDESISDIINLSGMQNAKMLAWRLAVDAEIKKSCQQGKS